ncbi:MAG: hypothetical protein ACHQQ3_03280 [Gemmatimonadales bacterium]
MSNALAAIVLATTLVVLPPRHATAPTHDARHSTVAPANNQEKHPKLRAAMAALEAAKVELKAAAHDFGGHRVDAIKAIDQATAQLKLALDYDKK